MTGGQEKKNEGHVKYGPIIPHSPCKHTLVDFIKLITLNLLPPLATKQQIVVPGLGLHFSSNKCNCH